MSTIDRLSPEYSEVLSAGTASVISFIEQGASRTAQDVLLNNSAQELGDRLVVVHQSVDRRWNRRDSQQLLASGPTLVADQSSNIGMKVELVQSILPPSWSMRSLNSRAFIEPLESRASVIVTPRQRGHIARIEPEVGPEVAELTRARPDRIVNPTKLVEVIESPGGWYQNKVIVGQDQLGNPAVEVVSVYDCSLDGPGGSAEVVRSRDDADMVGYSQAEELALQISGRIIARVASVHFV